MLEESFELGTTGAAVYELGQYGTAAKKRRELTFVDAPRVCGLG